MYTANPTAGNRAWQWLAIAVVAGFFIWLLSDVLLIGFAAVLLAVMLRAIAGIVQKFTSIGESWALVVACLAILAFGGVFFAVLGTQIVSETSRLNEDLPRLLSQIGNQFGVDHLDQRVVAWAKSSSAQSGLIARLTETTSLVVSAMAGALLAIAAGVFIAAKPNLYRSGILQLLPRTLRPGAAQFADTCGRALQLWLAGQLISMAAVGLLFGIGLTILGVPSAAALGFIAGIAEFVPYAGAALGAVPALLIAISEGGSMPLWVLGLYLLVQTIEGNLITPMVLHRAVDVPPVLTLFAIVAIGGLFGVLGLLLATPLTVVGFVAVKQFYVRDTLKEETSIPGEAT